MIDFNLSTLPPSTNNLYTNTSRRRVKSRKYREWRAAALWELQVQGLPKNTITGAWAIEIDVVCNRRRDIDNMVKPLLDTLSRYGLTPDDRYCDAIRVRRVGRDEFGDRPALYARVFALEKKSVKNI